MLNQININIKFTVSVMFLVTPRFVANLDYNILVIKSSLSAGPLELLLSTRWQLGSVFRKKSLLVR